MTLDPGQNTVNAVGSAFRAECPTGTVVVGTGFAATFGGIWDVRPYTTFVGGFAVNNGPIASDGFQLFALCAATSSGRAFSREAMRAEKREFLELEKEYYEAHEAESAEKSREGR